MQGFFLAGGHRPPRPGAPLEVSDRLIAPHGPGRPLPALVQRRMEEVFQARFADVRLFVGPAPAAIGALAFTHGSNIHLAPGRADLAISHNQRLLGHELAHVVQQRSGRVRNPLGRGVVVVRDTSLEAEAERMSLRVIEHLRTAPGTFRTILPRLAHPARPLLSGRWTGTIQLAKLQTSDKLKDEKSNFGVAVGYYYDVVEPWLQTVPEEHPEAAIAATNALQVAESDPRYTQDWSLLEQLIAGVNSHIGHSPDWAFEEDEVGTSGGNTNSESLLGIGPYRHQKIGTKKYKNSSAYVKAKALKQASPTRTHHLPIRPVKSLVKNATGGASQVDIAVGIQGDLEKSIKGTSTHKTTFSIPFTPHNHAYDTSAKDAEVKKLSAAYERLWQDLENHKDSTAERKHQLAIVGPYGACDGCKDRIKKFKKEWLKAAQKANCSATLVITYFYRKPADVYDRQDAIYGWLEAQQDSYKGMDYYYWSTNASFTAQKKK